MANQAGMEKDMHENSCRFIHVLYHELEARLLRSVQAAANRSERIRRRENTPRSRLSSLGLVIHLPNLCDWGNLQHRWQAIGIWNSDWVEPDTLSAQSLIQSKHFVFASFSALNLYAVWWTVNLAW